MKQALRYLPLLLTLLVTACLKETGGGADGLLEFIPVSVEITEEPDGPETKSLVSLEAEAFKKAALFAFDSSGKILLDGGTPVTKVTTSKNLSWSLPVGTAMDIYILANYGDLDLSSYLSSKTLRESDLEALTFSCADSEAFAALGTGGHGIPMAGVQRSVRIQSAGDQIPVQTKKLFSRYDFFFDTSAFTAKGYTVNAVYIASGKSNTEVPFFGEGFAQTSASKLRQIDYGTSSDVASLDYASRGHAVTLYFLENCQGNKSGIAHWWEVAGSGTSGLDLCSYIDLGIRATDPSGNQMTFFYWIYLGDDCTTNFDVRRNAYRTIKLTMKTPDEIPPTQGIAIIADKSVLGNTIPGACSLYFETNVAQADLSVASSRSEVTASLSSYSSTSEHHVTAYPRSGWVTASTTAAYNSGVNQDITAKITVGKSVSGQWSVSDQKEVAFSAYVPTLTYSLSVSAVSGTTAQAGETIALKAWYDTFSDGVRTGHSDVTEDSATTWECTSSNKAKITFPAKGSVKASAAGTYTIKASYGGKSSTIELTFTEADYITVSDWDKTWAWDSYGSGSALTAKVKTNLSRSSLTASCSNSEVSYTLSSTANSDGSYNLTLYWKSANTSSSERSAHVYVEGAGKSDFARVKQSGKPADEITYRLAVSPTSMSLTEGESSSAPTLYKEKYVNGTYDSRTTYTGSASWSVVSGSTYASVNSSTGVVTAKSAGAGSATVRATVTDTSFESGYRTADISVSVTKKEDVVTYRISRMSIASPSLDYSGTTTATVYRQKYVNGSASGGEETVSGSYFTWSSSNTGVATVSGGTITASSSNTGSATITATLKSAYSSSYESGHLSASASVTVSHDVSVTYGLTISGSTSATMPGTISLSATGYVYHDGSEYSHSTVTGSCTWSSSSSDCMVSGGVVSASKPGTYTITATHSTYGSDTHSVTFSRPTGFEWTSANNQSVNEGETITLSYETSSSSPTISWNPDKFTKVSQTTTANSGTASAYAYTGSITLRAADVDEDTTVTVSNNVSSATRTVLIVASWNIGFVWANNAAESIEAGGTATAAYYCSSLSPTISSSNASVISVTKETENVSGHGYRYSGTATITAASSATNGASATVTGSVSGSSNTDAKQFNVTNNTKTYALVLSPVGSTSAVYGSSVSLKAYFKTYTGGVETNSTDVTMAASYSGPSNLTITKNGSVLQAFVSSSSTGTYTVSATFTPAPQIGQLNASINVSFTDLITYDLRLETSAYSTEVGNSISITAYYDTYTNGTVTASTDVTSSCTWGKASSYVSVSGGVVTATKSCKYAGVGSYAITCNYTPSGKSKITKTTNVVFNPHTTSITWHWAGIREVDKKTYKVRIQTSRSLPCDVVFTHNGGPSYAGYNGMTVSAGSSQSEQYIFNDGYLPGLAGASPNTYYVKDEDRVYNMTGFTSAEITYL